MFNRASLTGRDGEREACDFSEDALAVLLPTLVLFTILMLIVAWPLTCGPLGRFHDGIRRTSNSPSRSC